MILTVVVARKCFNTRTWVIAGSIALLTCGARIALAQSALPTPGFLEHEAVMPPLMFREVWQQPPHTGPLNDENRRITPQALTNPELELRLYGADASNIQVTEHNGVPDLWTGFTTSPVALTLRHKNSFLDLTGLTRMRWRTRTENLHALHPVVKLADGTWLVGDFATNLYNGKFPAGDFTSHGTHWAWLGVNQGSGRIDFVFGKASQFSVLVSDLTPVVLEAYNSSDVLLATAGPAADNTGTGHMAELKITRATADIAYVVVHDSGNFFEIDDVCTDAPGVNVPVRQGSFTCRAVTGRLGSGHYGEANAALDPCKDDAKWSSTLAIGTVASLTAVQAVTSQTPDDLIANLPAVGDNGSAFASAGTVIVRISGVRIAVAAVSAAASARCNTLTSPTLSTASQVVGLSINGGLARTVTGPLTINVGLVKIELNKTTSTPTSRTRQALVVSSLLTPGKLVIGEATAGFVGNPCTT